MRVAEDAGGLSPFAGGVFVPTMGALHAGHAALIRRARDLAGRGPVVVSIFVNPTQFNERSDFERYPRTLEADLSLCRAEGVDCVFAPSVEVMYPPGLPVETPPLPEAATKPGLEDAFRPGHLAGVCQVCRRLFELVRPGRAVFGEKDWQQLVVVRAMVKALGMPIEIVPHATVREPDGLAMSSRNALLTPNHRRRAAALFRALEEACRHADARAAEEEGRAVLLANRIVPEYLVVRDAETLMPMALDSRRAIGSPRRPARGELGESSSRRPSAAGESRGPARALVAARVGGVRLIDNVPWGGAGPPE